MNWGVRPGRRCSGVRLRRESSWALPARYTGASWTAAGVSCASARPARGRLLAGVRAGSVAGERCQYGQWSSDAAGNWQP
eukprot:14721532-Alexandrium_andersonii.AAC.1